jgi:two-component system CheB/CheR fusion protein
VCRTSSKDQKSFTHECRIRRYDGEYRWILTSGKPTYSTEGIFTGFIGTSIEIHDQRLINRELEQRVNQRTNELNDLNKDLERSNHDLQQFASVASHDLQEPLGKIISFTDKLQKNKQQYPGETNSYLEKISSASLRMTHLIDDLLNFSRLTTTNQKFAKVNLDKIIKSTLKEFDGSIKEKKAKVKVGSLPVIEAVGIQMSQLFQNLLSNALKFSKEGIAPIIKIESHVPSARQLPVEFKNNKSAYIEIICTDNGIGFSRKFAEQVFNIFQRLNEREDYRGAGIGLALCRKIVNNHGGKIYAESTRNKGTSFHIILPVKQGV